MIFYQQVTEGQLIKKAQREPLRAFRSSTPGMGKSIAWATVYFFFSDFSNDSTRKTCSRICVPDSSLTLSVLDTITGPGVSPRGEEPRLKPLIPVTPCGMP